MAKRSKRCTSRHERNQTGCVSGIINVFQFRHGRATKRLPADRKQAVDPIPCSAGAGNSRYRTISPSSTGKCESLEDTEESKMPVTYLAKTSVKELMEEEMYNEKDSTQPNYSETGSVKKSGNHTKMHEKKKNRSAKSVDMDFDRVREQKPSVNNLDLEGILQELADINQINANDLDININEENLVQAVKLFIERKRTNDCCSRELTDVLNTLSSNKILFLKLLREPDSELFKRIQNFEDAQSQEKPKPVNSKPDDLNSHKSRNFFRRRTKSLDSYPLAENNTDRQSPNNIVILKPIVVGPKSPETDIALHNERSTSQFSFTEIKRKLRHAMGKESRGIDKLGENFGWSSPNRNHFYTERFTLSSPSFKKGEPVCKLKDEGPGNIKIGGSDIYIEAKKHLSEMVKSGDENTESTARNNSVKPLGRIVSLPEYNNSSPCLSPRKHGDELNPTMLNLKSQPSGSDSEGKIDSSLGDTFVSEVRSIVVVEVEQAAELRPREEENIISISCESSSDNEESASTCLKSHFFGQVQVMSPMLDQASTEIEDSDRAIDKTERPSPISVLEPLFADDDISPVSHPEIQPRHIDFKEEQPPAYDQRICTRISPEDEESEFEYVEAVLLGSGLNWDDFLLRWISFYEILDSSLFEEVELFSSRPRPDQKLLFDCANGALKEVCEFYFGCFANVKPSSSRPIPKGMDLIYEVWERVERFVFRDSQSHSLDRLVKRDLTGSENWMNTRSNIESIVLDMEEMIFDELVEEILSGYGDANS